MAVVVTGPDAKPVGSRRCMFELKEYTRPFTCRVCTVNSYDTVRYRCDHCDECRHVSCIRLDEEIRVGPGPRDIFAMLPVFTLYEKPQAGINSKNKKWAEYCLVCGMLIKHYSYHIRTTEKKDLNMHPRCAELIRVNNRVAVPLELHMGERWSCVWCGNKRPEGASPAGPTDFYCWSYEMTGGKNRIHVRCYSEMMTQALNSIADSHYYNDDDTIRIVLRRRKSTDGTGWEGILKGAFDIALEVAGLGLTQILVDLI
ncbi:uncharacterized protein LOC116187414 [Punica granatum]|uniref:Uncharacterized protein LOC116187414 n=1 Tax=Punica granatum TaxID=22663 RepID=A0A6P8BNP9_PUNGR|nr:uncharacterized protein LOC116187414 [Punica granatum]